jgi:hypothetical protein
MASSKNGSPARRTARRTVKKEGGFTVKDASISRARPFRWLWQDRVLLGYLNLMIGEEGAGKSTFVSWLAARTTRGELPGTLDNNPRRIVIIGDEDAWDHVWTPRLHAAGADLTLCKNIVSADDGSGIDITDTGQMSDLQDYIREQEIKLVFFDAMLDNLGYTDSWKDKQVRAAFAPLRSVVGKTESAVLFSMHPNKRGGSFRDRISGTPAFNALSRSSLLVAEHPTEPSRRVVVRPKGNYADEAPAFEFNIVERLIQNGRHKITATAIADIAETGLRAKDVLDGNGDGRRERTSDAARCERRIEELLADGEQHRADGILLNLGAERFSPTTIQRAATKLKVERDREKRRGGKVLWRLPSDA